MSLSWTTFGVGRGEGGGGGLAAQTHGVILPPLLFSLDCLRATKLSMAGSSCSDDSFFPSSYDCGLSLVLIQFHLNPRRLCLSFFFFFCLHSEYILQLWNIRERRSTRAASLSLYSTIITSLSQDSFNDSNQPLLAVCNTCFHFLVLSVLFSSRRSID